ncbi:MAG: DUF3147 family protein [Pseudomonadota bacterium]
MYLLYKTLVTAVIIVSASELAKRYTLASALLLSLPLTSLLAFIWIYIESKDTEKIIKMSYSVFWMVIPSLAFFLILPWLLKLEVKFPIAILLSSLTVAIIYAVSLALYNHIAD